MDSLRYWVIECHVDGFRFDLASALARELYDVDRLSAFFDVIHQDPVLSQVKLIAEPWDVGPGGYQVGNFPVAVERVERHLPRRRPRLLARRRRASASSPRASPARATSTSPTAASRSRRSTSSPPTTASRCATSSPTTRSTTRPTSRTTATAPTTTARGTAASRARPTTPRSTRCARRQQRNFLATLFLSQGVPMLLGGDEFGRTQGGNNNAWCQDNEISWYDWGLRGHAGRALRLHPAADRACAASTRSSAAGEFLAGREQRGLGPARRLVVPARRPAHDPARLGASEPHVLGVFLNGEEIADRDGAGRADRGRLVPAAVQRPPRGRDVHDPDAPLRRGVDARAVHVRAGASSPDATRYPRPRRACSSARAR